MARCSQELNARRAANKQPIFITPPVRYPFNYLSDGLKTSTLQQCDLYVIYGS